MDAREPQTGVYSPAETNAEGYGNEVAVIGIGEYRVVTALKVKNNPAYRVVQSQPRVEAEIGCGVITEEGGIVPDSLRVVYPSPTDHIRIEAGGFRARPLESVDQ